jgi:integrative and conjugative element protein (TIGR02256 family)
MWRSSRNLVTVWLTKDLLDSIVEESKKHACNETGGVLVGYSDSFSLNLVIEHVVGPGPGAVHSPFSFTPDHPYQEREVARLYQESGRISTYLGDWHSHPSGGLYLSPTDRKTLARIALSKEARIYRPIMAIIGGTDWELAIWQGSVYSYGILPPILRATPCKVRFFTSAEQVTPK